MSTVVWTRARARSSGSLTRVLLVGVVAVLSCTSQPASGAGGSVQVSTLDVHHFVQVYSALNHSDSTCTGLDRYFAQGTTGLVEYSKKFGVGPTELCASIRRHPERYRRLQSNLAGFDSASHSIDSAFTRLLAIYPDATLPRVYFVVGNGISGGTSLGTDPPTVLIGAELAKSLTHLPVVVAHEMAHAQQHYPGWKLIGAGPAFIRGTLLAQSIKEGSADFIAYLLTGEMPDSARNAYGLAHEQAVYARFKHDMHGKDYSSWLYNDGRPARLGSPPSDMGY